MYIIYLKPNQQLSGKDVLNLPQRHSLAVIFTGGKLHQRFQQSSTYFG